MRTCLSYVLGAALVVAGLAVEPPVPAHAQASSVPTVFAHATVIDVRDGQRLSDQTVVVVGHRIEAMGPAGQARTPTGARVVDARGKFLIPGLWDMHVHVRQYPATVFPFLLAHGVTGIRDMGQHLPLDSMRQWRREITAGARPGPRLVTAGTGIIVTQDSIDNATGFSSPLGGVYPLLHVATPADGRRVVDSLKTIGADCLKILSWNMTPEVYFAIAAEARRVGLPLVGHLPFAITAVQASDSGQRSIEHMNMFRPPCGHMLPFDPPDNADPQEQQECAAQLARLARNGTWITPTLVTWSFADEDGPMLQKAQQLLGAIYRAGVPLLAGTDLTPASETAAATVQQELALLVEAGLSPLNALQTATLNPAKYFNATDSLGTVAPGKLADLVLLDADPLVAIANTATIRAVVANGRYFDRAALDGLLVEARAKGSQEP